MTTHREQNQAIRDQFGKQAESYARLTGGGKNSLLESLLDVVKPSQTDHVLDVGCGPGRLSLSLAEFAGQVTGIDLTPEMLAQARARQAELGITNISWQQGDILPMPFADGAFSIVVTQATFHHFAEPAGVLAEMRRVCAPGGHVVVIDLTFDPAKGAAFDRVEKLRDPSHVRVIPLAELRAMGRAVGLQELTIQHSSTPMPFEAVLATSFPPPGNLERVRALFAEDVVSRADAFGLETREENGEVVVTYKNAMMIWRRI